MDEIIIQGARTHNLKNIDLTLPRNKLIVITGLSGSGKSSLAFDTLYAEGQRRYVESLSAYARQFLSVMDKPDVDHIEGLSPAISIEQKSTSHNPRSTVGTVTEIYDYLRLLFARIGIPHCPTHKLPLNAQTVSQMVDQIMALDGERRLLLLAPVIRNRKGEHLKLFDELKAQGFLRVRIDGTVYEIESIPKINPRQNHNIDVVVDRFRVREGIELRLAESLEVALGLSNGLAQIADMTTEEELLHFSANYACPECGFTIDELEPRLFSFNNPIGACQECDGLGVSQFFDPNRVVVAPELSLASGAIRGWDRNSAYYFSMMSTLATHYQFDIETPFNDLPKKIQKIILYGSGDEVIRFTYISNSGKKSIREHTFEGILPNLDRRYHETTSQMVRENLTRYLATRPCPACEGSRLGPAAKNVLIEDHAIQDVTALPIGEALAWANGVNLTGARAEIADKIFKEIRERLGFLVNVGLDYLNLSRSAETLSGGEAQRIRLASQIGAGLVGVLYVLDEPSIGLHQRDNERLLKTLIHLRDLGNTVIVVEHDEDAINAADFIVDIGPRAGVHGGAVVAAGTPSEIKADPNSLTGAYLSGREAIDLPKERIPFNQDEIITIRGASGNNLKNITAHFPIGLLTCVTGVSGSGKSTLVNDTLYTAMAQILNKNSSVEVAPYKAIEGLEHVDKIVNIDQSPIGRTPRSNPATYTGLFTPIRELFAGTPEARARGYTPGRFSFNVKGGRCEHCQGDGLIKVEMHFLPDIYVVCDECQGERYNRETLDILYKGKSISDVLKMTVEEAHQFFEAIPVIHRRLTTLMDVGLSYITLGQNATTLSGGEAQRVKLSRELSKRGTGRTLYILDEPTTGLHFHDIKQLLTVIQRLRDEGNTIIIIEHNLDVIKTADWIIDLGPEGGAGGGEIVIAGTPEEVAQSPKSHTGRFLKDFL